MDLNESESRPSAPARAHTVAGRLKYAADRQSNEGRRRGLRLFQQRISQEHPDLVGCALSTIQGYASGAAEPSLDFLRKAAALLNVRFPWLATGQGEPTTVEEEAAAVARYSRSNALERGLAHQVSGWPALSPHARSAVAGAWAAILGEIDPGDVTEQHGQLSLTHGGRVARDLGRALDQPLQTVGLLSGAIPEERDTYVVLVCEALRVYARGRRQAQEDFEAYWESQQEEHDGEA